MKSPKDRGIIRGLKGLAGTAGAFLALFMVALLVSPTPASAYVVVPYYNEPYGSWTVTGSFADGGSVNGSFTIWEEILQQGKAPFYYIPDYSLTVNDSAIIPGGLNPLNFITSNGNSDLWYGGTYAPYAYIDFYDMNVWWNGSEWISYELQLSVLAADLGLPNDPPLQSNSFFEQEGGTSTGVTGSVDPVPEPCTLLLLGSGLVGLAGWRRLK